MENYRNIIKAPIITEKTADLAQNANTYTFSVDTKANKTQIKLAVEEIFGVSVEKVNTANVHGKLKRQGRYEGYTSDYKKAIVQLKADSKSIEFFDSLS